MALAVVLVYAARTCLIKCVTCVYFLYREWCLGPPKSVRCPQAGSWQLYIQPMHACGQMVGRSHCAHSGSAVSCHSVLGHGTVHALGCGFAVVS